MSDEKQSDTAVAIGVPEAVLAYPRIKLSVNLTQEDINAIKWLAAQQKITQTDAIRRALGTEEFIQRAIANGDTVVIQHSDGQKERLVFR